MPGLPTSVIHSRPGLAGVTLRRLVGTVEAQCWYCTWEQPAPTRQRPRVSHSGPRYESSAAAAVTTATGSDYAAYACPMRQWFDGFTVEFESFDRATGVARVRSAVGTFSAT
jgi:hypothetical protein